MLLRIGLAAAFVLGTSLAAEAKRRPPEPPFLTDLAAGLETARAEGKPLVVTFIAAWCPICDRLKREVLPDPELTALATQFVWVRVDIDRQLTLARAWSVEGVPLTYVLDPEGRPRRKLLGLYTAEELRETLMDVANETGDPSGFRPYDGSPDRTRLRADLVWRPAGYRSAALCFSHVGYGPLSLYTQSPFQALRLGIRPSTPSTLGNAQLEARATATWVNVWAVDGSPTDPGREYFLDFEMLQTSIALAWGATDHVELELELQDRSRFGGELDGLSQGFHDLFGIGQNGRDEVPRGQFTFELAPPDGAPAVALDAGDRGSFSRTLQLSVQHNVSCGTRRRPALSYSLSARLETLDSEDLSGGSDLDLGASIALARRLGKFYVYGTLGYTWFGSDRFRGIELKDRQATFLAAGEWRFRARMSLVLQILLTEGSVPGFDPFSETSDELALGLKWEVRDRGVLELGVIENLFSFDNNPDVGFHFGFSQRF